MLNFLALVWAVCKQDWQERLAGSLLGSLWIFIWPLVQLAVYILIFGQLMGGRLGSSGMESSMSGSHAYGLYIASGLLCWTCFASSLLRGARSLVDKRGIIVKVRINLAVFPASACLGELIPFAAAFLLLVLAALGLGWRPQTFWLLMGLLSLCLLIILAFGLGLFFACLSAFARDINEAVPLALQLAFWFTPVVYIPTILPAWLAKLLWLNPMTCLTGIFQQCFVLGGEPHWGAILYTSLFSLAALALGLATWRRFNKDIRDVL